LSESRKQGPPDVEEIGDILKALSNPVRLTILRGIMQDECNVKRIQENLGLPQSTISQHLSLLRSKRIVAARKEGVKTCYSLVDERVRRILGYLFDTDGI
jgi:DNA-binding transcriptional ArsR family regulator